MLPADGWQHRGTGYFPGVKSGRGVTLTLHPLLVPWSWKGRAITLLPQWTVRPVQSFSACTRCAPYLYLHEEQYTFLSIQRSFLIRIISVSDKSCIENRNTHFVFSNFSGKSCSLWDNVEKCGTARQATNDNKKKKGRMRIACYRNKATDTLRICNTTAFSRQQWLRERVSMLRLLHVHCLSCWQALTCRRHWIITLLQMKNETL